jgi:putative FmdB family regulatory protein
MIYEFQCSKCNLVREVIRHHSEAGDPCKCDMCGNAMHRIYGNTQVSIPKTGYYNQALGCVVNSKADIRDAQKRIKDETGSYPVEVGNERLKKTPQLNSYDVPRGVFDGAIVD